MQTVKVKNTIIGEGMPKICVPIVAQTKESILEEVRMIKTLPVDVIEWRVDWFEGVESHEAIEEVLKVIAPELENIPLLFTFRTSKEGGERAIETDAYEALNQFVSATGLVDLIDVEVFTGDEVVSRIIESAHQHGVKVVASNHDFFKTPSCEEIVSRLRKMQDLGADIPKIAVMPTCKMDVLTLLQATVMMSETYADRPIITMSMAGTGVVSRLSGEAFGSALTFGASKKASAPGQIDVQALSSVLKTIHNSI